MGLILKYFSEFTDEQIAQLTALEELYKEWNAKINVVSRKDIESIYLHHVLHSLSIAAIADFRPGTQVIDIGCGGGFPGVPLAIFFPETEFHLVDSIAKKLKVVDAVCEGAGIKNISTQHTRAEDIKNRKFDFAVSRAVAPLKDLWTWAAPLIRKGTNNGIAQGLICLKGGDLNQEISESGLRPKMMPIFKIFPEEYFQEKYIIHAARN
ncbi:MAG: 16S rRNA (guanine(527)-N(7))-methyltransferase RsmG [Bacteroidetes bacterium 24-39-8]|nr:MAG: 16S rRNA (guanine(527)-N(7))-methyltransferase RsmG [Sphingobacteriia bacterium 35-40-8]OYZ51408.1 MAG: 16S rRNA (guanine(527)-N(7))-methyltransferase RsmG [Bacteroidetes bacterium 24-39-8]OZA64629.1 MAG: 16S rRNA (guanine(527)-N(7))-methyltransferase RsmG [Sphingobacteriia bacterium 39-39-8]